MTDQNTNTAGQSQERVDRLAGAIATALATAIGIGMDRGVAVAVTRAVIEKEEALLHLAAISGPRSASDGTWRQGTLPGDLTFDMKRAAFTGTTTGAGAPIGGGAADKGTGETDSGGGGGETPLMPKE